MPRFGQNSLMESTLPIQVWTHVVLAEPPSGSLEDQALSLAVVLPHGLVQMNCAVKATQLNSSMDLIVMQVTHLALCHKAHFVSRTALGMAGLLPCL